MPETAVNITAENYRELAEIGVTTVYEAAGRVGLLDEDFQQIVSHTSVAGPARIAFCGQGDNRAVHEAVARLEPGDVLVITMPEAKPIGVIGDLLVTQMKAQGAVGVLVNAAVRDAEELEVLGLPISTRWIRSTGATKHIRGSVDVAVTIGGTTVNPGDTIILDRDGAVAVPAGLTASVLEASRTRVAKEEVARGAYLNGALSYDQHGFRAEDEAKTAS